MSDLTLTFIKAGLFTSIQDLGRQAMGAFGIPKGGVLDRGAAKAANDLLNLPVATPVLEITLLGPEIHFSDKAVVAITGATFPLTLNNEPISTYQRIDIPKGSILKFGHAIKGCRAYLSILAPWRISSWQGSVSPIGINTDLLSEHIMRNGQQLQFKKADIRLKSESEKTAYHAPNFDAIKRIRVTTGPEFEVLTKVAIAQFFGSAHTISRDASRMGYRLESILQMGAKAKEMISSGILPGTVQVTSGGQPIILLADAQTTGGYPRIVRVIDEDLDTLAQMKPGDKIWFSLDDL